MAKKVNLRDYGNESDEVTRFKHESVKSEVDKCMSCGFCDQVCGEYLLDKNPAQSHREKLFQIKNFSKDKKVEEEYIRSIYHSTLTNNAYKVCPADIDHDYIITEAREEKFMQAIEMKEFYPMRSTIRFLEDPSMENPFGKKKQEKFNWLDIDTEFRRADFLYFVGCADAFFNHERVKKVQFILDRLKIKYTISRDEKCCGHLARVLGREKAAARLKQENKEMILKSRLKNIIVSCAHCYDELKRDYDGTDITIWHITELIANKIAGFNAKQIHKFKMNASYQDPCMLREKSMQKVARNILKNIGFEIKEMRHSGDHSVCCGSGGGFNINFKEESLKMGNERIKESIEAGADAIITNCPFCLSNLQKSKRKFSSKQKIYDLVTLVADSIKWTND